jgi:hypothetical protein
MHFLTLPCVLHVPPILSSLTWSSSSLCACFCPPVTSSVLGPNILLSTSFDSSWGDDGCQVNLITNGKQVVVTFLRSALLLLVFRRCSVELPSVRSCSTFTRENRHWARIVVPTYQVSLNNSTCVRLKPKSGLSD